MCQFRSLSSRVFVFIVSGTVVYVLVWLSSHVVVPWVLSAWFGLIIELVKGVGVVKLDWQECLLDSVHLGGVN